MATFGNNPNPLSINMNHTDLEVETVADKIEKFSVNRENYPLLRRLQSGKPSDIVSVL